MVNIEISYFLFFSHCYQGLPQIIVKIRNLAFLIFTISFQSCKLYIIFGILPSEDFAENFY